MVHNIYIELRTAENKADQRPFTAYRVYAPSPASPTWEAYNDDGRGNGDHLGEGFSGTSLAGVLDALALKIVKESF